MLCGSSGRRTYPLSCAVAYSTHGDRARVTGHSNLLADRKNMTYFPLSYEDSRERFRRSLMLIRERWPDARLENHPMKDHPDLTIDWLWAEPRERENLVVLSAGQHGIEGYVGAAMLKVFIQEFAPRLNPENTGLLLVHAINPWGMHNWLRVNPNNVDLNRNFVYNGRYDPAINPAYDRLFSLLNPQEPVRGLALERTRFVWTVITGLISPGMAQVKAATLLGQHRHSEGIYYGGIQVQEETRVLMGLYRRSLERYRTLVHIDMHSGYGPRYQMTVLVPPQDSRTSAQAVREFRYPLVQKIDADEFYAISGDMNEYFNALHRAEFPDRRLLSSGFEFGTFGDSLLALIRSLNITILENQLRQHGAGNETIAQAVRKEYRELFLPAEDHWRRKALEDGRQAMRGLLSAYQLLGE